MTNQALTQADPLFRAFERNGRVNAAMLSVLSDADLKLSQGGGWNIGKHLCHLVGFRRGWLSYISPLHAEPLAAVVEYVGADDFEPIVHTVAEIAAGFREGDAAALAAVQAALAEGRSFEEVYESNPVNYLVHAMIHDAHHRGQIMSMLRQSGRTYEQMDALEYQTWPIWRE